MGVPCLKPNRITSASQQRKTSIQKFSSLYLFLQLFCTELLQKTCKKTDLIAIADKILYNKQIFWCKFLFFDQNFIKNLQNWRK